MKKTQFKEIHFMRMSEILMQAALGVSAVTESPFVVSDMVHSLSDFSDKANAHQLTEPYYFAIREMGVESGTRTWVEGSCAVLGYPIVLAKVEVATYDYNMSIKFTDQEWSEDEFNNI